MDFIKSLANDEGQNNAQNNNQANTGNNQPQNNSDNKNTGGGSGSGFFDNIANKMNAAAGGGRESEKDEDYLDKGVDFVQEKFLGQGAQDNETAVEQAKDEQISDYIRKQYRSTTGSDMPIKDKATALDSSTD